MSSYFIAPYAESAVSLADCVQSKQAKPKRYKTTASVPYRHGASKGVCSQQRDDKMEESVHVQQGGGVRVVHGSYRLLKMGWVGILNMYNE